MEEFSNISACPYCGVVLEKFPTRKAQCKSCKNFYYIRTDPRNNKKVLATENGIKQIESLWERRREYENLEKMLSTYGLKPHEIQNIKQELSKKFNNDPSPNDVAWSALIHLSNLEESSIYPDYRTLSRIYREMASILSSEGRNFFEKLKQSYKFDLLANKRELEKYTKRIFVTINPSYDMTGACENCREQYGKKVTIEYALENDPLPHLNCCFEKDEGSPGWCRCRYEYSTDYS